MFLTVLLIFVVVSVYSQTEYKYIQDQSDSIYYELKGAGNPILFLSGGPGAPPESLASIVDYLSDNNKTILLHQRGTGLSGNNKVDWTTITLDKYIADIDNIIEKEKIDQLYIVGHSWGAILALEYLTRKPANIKGLILLGSSGYTLDFVQEMNDEIFKRMTSAEKDSLQVYFNKLSTIKDSSLANDLQGKIGVLTLSKQFYNPLLVGELMKDGGMNMNVNHLMMNDLLKRKWNLKETLGNLKNPVLIINGDHDPIDKKYVQDLKSLLKNSELHYLDNCGHYLWIEKPMELKKLILGFLDRN